jgi:hypothetical protein
MSGSVILTTATLASLAALLLAGCTTTAGLKIVGSGNRVTVDKDLSGFDKVAANSAFQVDISQSDGYGVTVTVDEKVVPYLDVTVQGETLRIGVLPGKSLSGAAFPMHAAVSMPRLTGLELSGATRTTIGGFKSGERLDVKISGASQLQGDIETGDVDFEASGASRIGLSGKGQKMALEVSGASQGNLDDFVVSDATVELSGASHATVHVTGKLDADVSGASGLRYAGTPTLGSVKSSGASSIRPK